MGVVDAGNMSRILRGAGLAKAVGRKDAESSNSEMVKEKGAITARRP